MLQLNESECQCMMKDIVSVSMCNSWKEKGKKRSLNNGCENIPVTSTRKKWDGRCARVNAAV
eukprot:scaffold216184_cov21-Tisochrysis_lutea.AAC.1